MGIYGIERQEWIIQYFNKVGEQIWIIIWDRKSTIVWKSVMTHLFGYDG
jgi:hypothetical protein